MAAYYNEFDPKVAAWLRELIKRGLIADGEVDDRSILDVHAEDLRGFTQCHFFAGIGGWSYALRLAEWPDDRPVWTGSPPCQPFSAAGQQKGKSDDRHLAPHFAALVAAGRPPILFGEQVASAAVFGKAAKRAGDGADGAPQWAWIDDLSGRLEAAHYAVGASDIPAAGVGAPHLRQRTFFGAVRLADASGERHDGQQVCIQSGQPRQESVEAAGGGGDGRLGDASWSARQRDTRGVSGRQAQEHGSRLAVNGPLPVGPEHAGAGVGGLADADYRGEGPFRGLPEGPGTEREGVIFAGRASRPGADHGGWAVADWLFCRDGKWRPVEPGTFPLAHGIPARVVRLRGYGNAIVPQAAAEFIEAFMEAHQEATT